MGRLAPSTNTDVYLEVLETSSNPISKSEEAYSQLLLSGKTQNSIEILPEAL